MKLFHTSDWHLGRMLYGRSLLEDQRWFLRQVFLPAVERERPCCVLIAGDVYDRQIAPVEAIALFDETLSQLLKLGTKVCVIAGNHDGPGRMALLKNALRHSGVYFATQLSDAFSPVLLEEKGQALQIFPLPYFDAAQGREFLGDESLRGEGACMELLLERLVPLFQPGAGHLLVSHCFAAGAQTSDSESATFVGGSGQVPPALFAPFDYVALGHIHGPQQVGKATIRYCGTPLKYSFSEANHEKSVTVVEMEEKGNVSIRTIPLMPLRDLREIRGSYEEVTLRDFYEGKDFREDYLHIILTDEEDVPDGAAKLRLIYPNLMKLSYDNRRTQNQAQWEEMGPTEEKSPLAMLEEFYEKQNGQPMQETQRSFALGLMEEIWEDEPCDR